MGTWQAGAGRATVRSKVLLSTEHGEAMTAGAMATGQKQLGEMLMAVGRSTQHTCAFHGHVSQTVTLHDSWFLLVGSSRLAIVAAAGAPGSGKGLAQPVFRWICS